MDGIAGIYSQNDKNLAQNLFLVTGMNQHRGKKSAGIAVSGKDGITIFKGLGRLGEIVDLEIMTACQRLNPVAGIGNVGYTKNKVPEKRNAEPIRIYPKNDSKLEVVLTVDGYLVEEDDLKVELERDYTFNTQSKTEVIGALLHKYLTEEGISFEAGRKLVDKLEGRATYAINALIHEGRETYLMALNDEKAFEPFCFGSVNGSFVTSSESVSHKKLFRNIEREYDGAEMTICSSKGI